MAACLAAADAKWSRESEGRKREGGLGGSEWGKREEGGKRGRKCDSSTQGERAAVQGGRELRRKRLICSSLICLGSFSHLGPDFQSASYSHLIEGQREGGW